MDKNGNSAGYLQQHGILSQYDFIGIDSREFAIFDDLQGNRQEAYLDHNGDFEHGHLRQGGFFGGRPETHVVETAEEYGPWMYVEPEFIDGIEAEGLGDIEPGAQELTASREAEKRWRQRAGLEKDLTQAWEEALEFEWPRENDPATARYHPEAGTPILREGSELVTVYPTLTEMDDPEMRQRIRRNLPEEAL